MLLPLKAMRTSRSSSETSESSGVLIHMPDHCRLLLLVAVGFFHYARHDDSYSKLNKVKN